jgi:DNA-directed RNA polymerase subunit RPC12/RpoP
MNEYLCLTCHHILQEDELLTGDVDRCSYCMSENLWERPVRIDSGHDAMRTF